MGRPLLGACRYLRVAEESLAIRATALAAVRPGQVVAAALRHPWLPRLQSAFAEPVCLRGRWLATCGAAPESLAGAGGG